MTQLPCSTERLLMYAFGEPADAEREAIVAHVSSCWICAADLQAVRVIADGADWRDQSKPAAPPAHDVVATARMLSARGAAARQRADTDAATLLNLPPRQRHIALARHPEMLSPALAWALVDIARPLMTGEPRRALAIFDLVTFVTDACCNQVDCPELLTEVWKNLGWLRAYYVGDYVRAEEALDFAEDAASRCADRVTMTAIVQLTRGILLSQMERWSEALPLVLETRKIFEATGDRCREIKAIEQEANIRMRSGDPETAVALLARLVDLPATDATRAERFGSIAHALEMTGALGSASEFIARSREIHIRANVGHLIYRDTWVLARILGKYGRLDEAIEAFREAAAGFRQSGAADNAIRVELDQSELELENGMPTDQTYARLRAAATYAIDKDLPVAKCRALEYLRQLADADALDAAKVRHVREFFAGFGANPHARFIPLSEAVTS